MYKKGWKLCMACIENARKEIVVIGYYNVLFYLIIDKDADEFNKYILFQRIQSGERIMMRNIHEWCQKHRISFVTKYRYRKDFSIMANIWNFYSYCRFKIEKRNDL